MRFVKLNVDDARMLARGLLQAMPVELGVCRVCGCVDEMACEGGCTWVDDEHTLCSACCPPPVLTKDRTRARRHR